MRFYVRALSAVALAFTLTLLAACRGGPEPAPPPTSLEVPPVAPDAASTAHAAAPATTAANGVPNKKTSVPPIEPPPSGMYSVAMSDRANNCALLDGGAPEGGSFWVTIDLTEDGKWKANMPINVGVGSPAIDRSSVILEVGTTTNSAIQPDRTCNYQVRRDMKVTEVTPSKIVVDVHAEFTNAVRCTLPRRPTNCTRDVVVTYSLTRPFCASRCSAKPVVQRDGGVEASCTCDDAGAR